MGEYLRDPSPDHGRGSSESEGTRILEEKQNYLSVLSQELVKNGVPAHRLERYLKKTAEKLGWPKGTYHYIPGLMSMEHEGSRKIVSCKEGGVDLGNLFQIHSKNIELIDSKPTDFGGHLKHWTVNIRPPINSKKVKIGRQIFYTSVKIFLYFFTGWLMALLGYQASIEESLFAGFFCAFVFFVQDSSFTQRWNAHQVTLVELTYVFTLTIAIEITSYTGKKCFAAMALAPLAYILPTSDFVVGFLELSSGLDVSGATRLARAIIRTLVVQIGIALGGAMFSAVQKSATSSVACTPQAFNPWWRMLMVFPFTLSLIVFQFEAAFADLIFHGGWKEIKMWLHVIISFGISMLSFFFYNLVYIQYPAGRGLPNFVACIIIGVLGHVYRRYCKGPSAMVMLTALSLQIPSSVVSSADLAAGLASVNELSYKVGIIQDSEFRGSVVVVDPATVIIRMIGVLLLNAGGVALGLLAGFWIGQLLYKAKNWLDGIDSNGEEGKSFDWDPLDF